jgi:Carbamoyl-phosphate synthase L chain, ATP binding domain
MRGLTLEPGFPGPKIRVTKNDPPLTAGRRLAAVVWPYSTALWLGRTLRGRGWGGVAVVPADPAACGMPKLDLDEGDWDRVLTDPGDVGQLAALLGDVSAVIPGDESAVPLAETVAARLGLPGSDPRTSAARTDKAVMQQALERAMVPHPKTIRASSLRAALAAAKAVGWPVVVKPRWSASSVGVSVCHSPAEVAVAWMATAGQPGALGEITRVVAVQEYLAGQKWTVDTVTVPRRRAGLKRPVHVVTSVWRERVIEISGHIAWGESWLVPPAAVAGDPAARVVTGYAKAVLEAAGVAGGPACTEIVLTSRGPRLVEVMARLAGCYPVHLVELVTGQSQVTSAVDALTDPRAFARRAPAAGGGQAVAQAWLLAPHDAVLDGTVLSEIRDLPSVVAASRELKSGAPVQRTIDTPTSPGRLDLLGPPGQVGQDISAIRKLEHKLYRRRT